jgi:hypothetical protein
VTRVFVAGAAVVAAIAAGQACTAHNQSDDLRCDEPDDCTDGRDCVNGYCVYDEDFADAGVDADERCPPPCTSCTGLFDDAGGYSTCLIDCNQNGDCASEVICPFGMECQVTCSGVGSCGDGVDCRNASACTINCTGVSSCDGSVRCGPGRCNVACNGNQACDNEVDCSMSCSCDVACIGNTCDQGVLCQGALCETAAPLGCSSTQDPSCNTCAN